MITLSQLKYRSTKTVSEKMGINIVRLTGKRKKNYFITNDDGITIGFLGKTRADVTVALASCFTADELGSASVPEEQVAKQFMYPTFELDEIQNGKYRSDITGHESICDYIRACYRHTFLGGDL